MKKLNLGAIEWVYCDKPGLSTDNVSFLDEPGFSAIKRVH